MGSKPSHVEPTDRSRQPTYKGKQLNTDAGFQGSDNLQPQSIRPPHPAPTAAASGAAKATAATSSSPPPPPPKQSTKAETPPLSPLTTTTATTPATETDPRAAAPCDSAATTTAAAAVVAAVPGGGSGLNSSDYDDAAGASVFLTEPAAPIKPTARKADIDDDIIDNGTGRDARDKQSGEEPKENAITKEEPRDAKSRDGKKSGEDDGEERKEEYDHAAAPGRTDSVTTQHKLVAKTIAPGEIIRDNTESDKGGAEQSQPADEERNKRNVRDEDTIAAQDISVKSTEVERVNQEETETDPNADKSGEDAEKRDVKQVLNDGVLHKQDIETKETEGRNGSDHDHVITELAGTTTSHVSLGQNDDYCGDDEIRVVNAREKFATKEQKNGGFSGYSQGDGEENDSEQLCLHEAKDCDEAQDSADVVEYHSEHRGSIHFRLVTFLTDKNEHTQDSQPLPFSPTLLSARRDSSLTIELLTSPSSRKSSSQIRTMNKKRVDEHRQDDVPIGKSLSPEVIIKNSAGDVNGGISPDQSPPLDNHLNGVHSEQSDATDQKETRSQDPSIPEQTVSRDQTQDLKNTETAPPKSEAGATGEHSSRRRSTNTKPKSTAHEKNSETQQSQAHPSGTRKRLSTRDSTGSFGRVRLASRKSESSLQGSELELSSSRTYSSQTRRAELASENPENKVNSNYNTRSEEESGAKPSRGIKSAGQNQETPPQRSSRPSSQTSRGSMERTRPMTRDKSGTSLSRIPSAREKPDPPVSSSARAQSEELEGQEKSADIETSSSSSRRPAGKGRPLSRDSDSSFSRIRSAKRKPEVESSATEERGTTQGPGSHPLESSAEAESTNGVTTSQSSRQERGGSSVDGERQCHGHSQDQQKAASTSTPSQHDEDGSPSRPKRPGARFEKPSSRRMEELDNHVLNTPKQLNRYQPYQLVEYLLSPTQTEIEAAYVIYRWVACLLVPIRKKGRSASSRTTEEVKKDGEDGAGDEDETIVVSTLATYEEQLKQGTIGHADMFSLLCKYANLETHKVTGKVRFYCSQPSAHLCRTRQASWSAILLPGGWGHVDCNLGSRHWAAHRRSTKNPSVTSSHPSVYAVVGAASGHSRVSNQEISLEESVAAGSAEAASGSGGRKPEEEVKSREGGRAGSPERRGVPRLGRDDGGTDGSDNSRAGVDGKGSAAGVGDDEEEPQRGRSNSEHVAGSDDEAARLHEHAPHNFYFLPPPEMLVSSHLPDNARWQLLPAPVSEADFATASLLRPQAHYLNVDIVCPTSVQLKGVAKETDVVWKVKGEELRRFAFRLFHVTNNGLSCEQLTRYGFLENRLRKKEATLRLIPPCTGRYVCELFGTYLHHSGNEMTHMTSFELEFVETITTPLQFPQNSRAEWGPGAECAALGLRPLSHDTGCINVDGGEVEVVFRSSRPVLVTQKLLAVVGVNNDEKRDDDGGDEEEGSPRSGGDGSNGAGDGTVEVPHATVNFRDAKNRVKILLRIPEAGDYVLGIYAKEESSPGKCQLICNYLVLCDSGIPEVVHPFPSLPYNKLGPTKAFTEFRMRLVCPKKSPIVVAPYSGKVTFVFARATPDAAADDTEAAGVELSCDLHHLGKDGAETTDAGEYVQHTGMGVESVFRARLPEAGDYLFYLYGRPADGEGHKFLLYTALVECAVPNKDCLPLPRVVPDWRTRVHILAPLRKFLVLGAVTHFAVRAYNVKAVCVIGQSGTQEFVNEDEEEEEEQRKREARDFEEKESSSSMYSDERGVRSKAKESVSSVSENDVRDVEHPDTRADTDNDHGDKAEISGSRESGRAEDSSVTRRTSSYGLAQVSGSDRAQKSERFHGNEEREDGEEEDEEEADEGWQVWKCRVKVEREDEGSGVRLCVKTSRESSVACVAEFEVITERNMAARLDHQHSVWSAEEVNFKVRPDSGHRSHLDDEETQSAYFLDDEVYLSNPLGDENSDDNDSDDDEDDDIFSSSSSSDEDYGNLVRDDGAADNDDDADANDDDTAVVDRGVARTSTSERGHKQQDSSSALEKGTQRKSGESAKPKKATNDQRNPEFKRAIFHPSLVYGVSQCPARSQAHRDKHGKGGDSRGGEETSPKKSRANREKKTTESDLDISSESRTKRQKGGRDAYFSDDPNRQDGAGSKERSLRRKLWNACQRREREAIEKAVARYTRGGYPPCPDLTAAERLLHLFKLRDTLSQALDSKDTGAVRTTLTEVERHGYAGEMSVLCRKAHAFLSPHRAHGGSPGVVEADLRTLLEIRSYRCPPEVIRRVMTGVLLLIGFHEGLTKNWKGCRRRLHVLGPDGIQRKMTKVKIETIHPEIAARADELLDPEELTDVHSAGPGVLAVYKWARDVITSVESLQETDNSYNHGSTSANDKKNKEKGPPPKPATKRRQREIFKEQQQQTVSLAAADSSQTDNANTDDAKTSSRHNTAAGETVTKSSNKSAARGGKGNDTPRSEKKSGKAGKDGKDGKGKTQLLGHRGGRGADPRSGVHHTANEGGRSRQQQQKKEPGVAGQESGGVGDGDKKQLSKSELRATKSKHTHHQEEEEPAVNQYTEDVQDLPDNGYQKGQDVNASSGEAAYSESLRSYPSTTNAVCGSHPTSVKSELPARTSNADEGETDKEDSNLLAVPADLRTSSSESHGDISETTTQEQQPVQVSEQESSVRDGKDDDNVNAKDVRQTRPLQRQRDTVENKPSAQTGSIHDTSRRPRPNPSPERKPNSHNKPFNSSAASTNRNPRSEQGRYNRSPERGSSKTTTTNSTANGFVPARSASTGRYKSPERGGPGKNSYRSKNGGFPDDKRRRPATDPAKGARYSSKSPERASKNAAIITTSNSNGPRGNGRSTETTQRRPQQAPSTGGRGPGGGGGGRSSTKIAPAPSRHTRWGDPTDPLASLSPHKSPLFRPAHRGRTRAEEVRARSSFQAGRPRTHPVPVLQSTFFFASVVKKTEEEEDKEAVINEADHDKATFNPYSHQKQQEQQSASHNPESQPHHHHRVTATGPDNDDSAAVATMETTRVGDNLVGGLKQHQLTPNGGGRCVSEMATPDI